MPNRRKNGKRSKARSDIMTSLHNEPQNSKTPALPVTLDRDSSRIFKDLRSPSLSKKRTKAQKWKYFDYEIAKPGQISLPHYECQIDRRWPWLSQFPANLTECSIVNLNKKQLYDDAQRTAPYWKQGHRGCCDYNDKFARRDAERKQVSAKAQAREWYKFGVWRDFSGQVGWDHLDYDEAGWMDCDYWDLEDEYWDLAEQDDPISGYGYDLNLLTDLTELEKIIEMAEKAKTPQKESGWEDLESGGMSSPEMDWVGDEFEFEAGDDFEWI